MTETTATRCLVTQLNIKIHLEFAQRIGHNPIANLRCSNVGLKITENGESNQTRIFGSGRE